LVDQSGGMQGEVVEGAEGNMLAHAMVNLGSSKAVSAAGKASEPRLKYRCETDVIAEESAGLFREH
jgi:hypothetical protein